MLSATLDSLGPWLALIGFGAFHGLNPGMGWLFALALGLQQNNERVIFRAMVPIALGHAASVALVATLLLLFGAFIPLHWLSLLTAAVLLGFGLYKLLRYYRHPRWVGMRVGMGELFNWSFLMATAHGAGLMLAPLLLGMISVEELFLSHHHGLENSLTSAAPIFWIAAIGLHTLAMLLVMIGIAWVVYRKLGLMVLRSRWVNFDLMWAVALLVVGTVALFTSISGKEFLL